MSKWIKAAGLISFLAGFALFNGLFFSSEFRLTPDSIRAAIQSPGKADEFVQAAADEVTTSTRSQFAFVASVTRIIDHVNQQQISTYRLTDEELDALVNVRPERFSVAAADTVFPGADEVSAFKCKAVRDYAGWLEGTAATRQQLQLVATNIETYAIVSQFGFDRYAAKDVVYALAKSSASGPVQQNPTLFLALVLMLCIGGALLYLIPKLQTPAGIQNHGIFFSALKNTGWLGVLVGSWLIAFYVVLYFFPEYMTTWVTWVDPVSRTLSGQPAGRFFLYGFLYTLAILVMGVRFMIHYRHSRYQLLRTASVMFFQTAFAFLIPEILTRLNKPALDLKNIWPLDYSFFFDYRLDNLLANGTLGLFMLGWGIVLIIVVVPVFVYFFGKRWYCSWVCGCGGLAETLGDPYRQLSDKRVKAWKVERWMIHGVLVFAVVMTGGVLYTYFTGSASVFFFDSYKVREWYGAFIGAGFAGVVGTGFYPLMGNRVWCRFGCPLAAYLGLVQRFKSRFRITTNGGQCISCGNCSTYCEMGIDVRWYAQRGQNIVRSSCVGCGICSSVCPRGVLNLEVKDEAGRFGKPILIGNNHVRLEGSEE
jgi:polyferredoxin